MTGFITLDDCSLDDIEKIISSAKFFEKNLYPSSQSLKNHTIVTLFSEPSTRTRLSFTIASERLGANVINIDAQYSGLSKGESLEQTLHTLAAMDVRFVIIRQQDNHALAQLKSKNFNNLIIINAGSGVHSHPTQALADLLTIKQKYNNIQALKIAIIGDIIHSRVAQSNLKLWQRLGIENINLIGPPEWLPEENKFKKFNGIDNNLESIDIIMALRVQHERMENSEWPNPETYHRQFGLNAKRLKNISNDFIIMHPGPVNEDIEITKALLHHSNSMIQQQVRNGVAVRMALLEFLNQKDF